MAHGAPKPRSSRSETVPRRSTLDVDKRAASARRKAIAYSLLGALTLLRDLAGRVGTTRLLSSSCCPRRLAVADRMWRLRRRGTRTEGIAAGTVFVALLGDLPPDAVRVRRVRSIARRCRSGSSWAGIDTRRAFFFDFVYLAANVPLIVYAILGLVDLRAR